MVKPQFKPTEQQLVTIKELFDARVSYQTIAERFGYDRHTIQKIAHRGGWEREGVAVWTDERKEQFKRLYATGMSHSEIARTMGTTKDACLSLRRRMKLPERAKIKNHVPERPVTQVVQHYTAVPETPRPDHGVLIWDLEPHHCRWPIHGEPDEHMLYCGEPKEEACSYCAKHVAESKPHVQPHLNHQLTQEERAAGSMGQRQRVSNFFLRRITHIGG